MPSRNPRPPSPTPSVAETQRRTGSSWRSFAALLALLVVVGGGIAAWKMADRVDPVVEIREARAALKSGDLNAAVEHASRVHERDPRRPKAALIEGEARFRLGQIPEAAAVYEVAAAADGPDAGSALVALGELWRGQGCLQKSERYFLAATKNDPTDSTALDRLILLSVLSGRRWEALPYARARIDLGRADPNTYLLAADPERMLENAEYLAGASRSCPDDPLVAAGLGVQAFAKGRFAEARSLLDRDDFRKPGWGSVQAVLGELCLSDGPERFSDWYHKAVAGSSDSPEFHVVCGLFARNRGEFRVAAKCFKEAVRLAPNHHRGNYQLSQVLVHLSEQEPSRVPGSQVERPDQALLERLQQKVADLRQLELMLERLHKSGGRSEGSFKAATSLLERTGQIRLAAEFAVMAASLFPQATWTHESIERLASNPLRAKWEIDPEQDLSRRVDVGAAPEFGAWLDQLDANRSKTPGMSVTARIVFRKEPDERLPFEYRNGHDPAIPGLRMQEQLGGGVTVFDYDRDGWPDLFLPQGGEWPEGSPVPRINGQSQDGLFRNRPGLAFADVSTLAEIDAGGYGQGAAAGDLNGDGFPDLYVANIGVNDLWANEGDGTFSRVPIGPEAPPSRWTTSCAMFDLNRDGHADLVDVNYVVGDDIFLVRCNGKVCSPKSFAGSPDDIWVSDGEGGFRRLPDTSDPQGGKGLGIVAFSTPSSTAETAAGPEAARLDLLIANDQVPNFLLRNRAGEDRASFHLENDAFLSGLALNQDGVPMASMGIACDDSDGDGLLDFFITNFKDEYDGLYRQQAGGLFQEVSATAGLHGSNIRYVGWGTQFLDADLDGFPDIVATNGHVDDYRDEGGDFAMPPQFYHNLGNGEFKELPAEELGDFFRTLFHGRGLARIDWNRDGLPDFVVSNINQPASLVTNVSTGAGRFLKIRLVGTISDRDAIGTRVRVTAGGRTLEKQLVAGDGYMASNERCLHFGLGGVDQVDAVEAIWMSGRRTRLTQIPIDRELTLIEDAPASAWIAPRPSEKSF